MTVGPVVFTTVGDAFIQPATIASILWEGSSISGDRVEIMGRGESNTVLFWPARTDIQQTYLGITFGERGLSAPHGFRAAVLTAGRVVIYLKEA